MPPRSSPASESSLLDTWGRKNRSLADRVCPQCRMVFRPIKASSKYCSRPCAWANNGGHNRKDESWWVNQKGYIEGRIWVDGVQKRVKQHRHIASQHGPLPPDHDVHHLNGDKSDNTISNFAVLPHGEHSTLHNKNREVRRGYKMNLSDSERRARSVRMKNWHNARAAIAAAEGRGE